jgi:glycosyltransferase involved in cell wall biosynthesis
VILESMSCATPVLAAAEGGPLEILSPIQPVDLRTEAVGGWLVTPRNATALSQGLRKALSLSDDELRKIGQLGRLRAEDHFSARAFARGVAGVIQKVSSS